MSHTNSTTNYSLPQFLTSDKPAWLTDINNAFSDIDTGMHNAQTKANTADTNASQAILDAATASTAASAADSKGAGAVASLADTFQTTETYAVGDIVIYNNLLYKCSVAVETPGAWTGSTNWSRTTLETEINASKSEVRPVGSIYMSIVDDTVAKVQARFGGTWQRIAEGTTLFGYKSDNTNFNTVDGNKNGGNESHTLTIQELPSHSHSYAVKSGSAVGSYQGIPPMTGSTGAISQSGGQTNNTGSGSAINILNPYTTVYMYVRTA